MRILGVLSNSLRPDKPDYVSPVDMWRIYRPLKILKERTDWKIDIVTEWIDNKATGQALEEEYQRILRDYDLVFYSYTRSAQGHCVIKVLEEHGLKAVMDIDDYMFKIPDFNPAKLHLYEGSKDLFVLSQIIKSASHITTTTDLLKKLYLQHGAQDIEVLPNFISTDFYQHEKKENNGKVVIGYVGGTSHHEDFHATGFLNAIEKVLKLRPNAIFHAVGMPVVGKKLPPDQYKFTMGALKGKDAWQKLFASLDFDIMTAPLANNIFNACKSDIKYQESALAHAPVILSDVPCYSHCKHVLRARNEQDWVDKLLYLIDNQPERSKLAKRALDDVLGQTLERHWVLYKNYFERIVKHG